MPVRPGKPVHLHSIKDNFYNEQFSEGEIVSFYFDEQAKILRGTILIKYTNSCLIDISSNIFNDIKFVEKFNGKVVVNYKNLDSCLLLS